jgi:hypothetical protein
MSISLRSSSEGHSNSINQTVTKPAGTADGDLLIAVVCNYVGNGGDVTGVPSGWTQFGTTQTWRVGNDTKARIYYKIANSEGASYTWTSNMGSPAWQIYIAAYQGGIDAANPINQSSENKITTGINPISGTSITPTLNNCLIVTICLARQGAASTADITPPSGYTLEWERADTTFATRDEAADLLQTTAAATGALAWTLAFNQSGASIVYTFAISPPALEDSGIAPLILTPSGSESPGLGSLGTVTLISTPSGVDITNLNEGTIALKLTPSATEVKDTNDVGEKYLDLQPSGVEAPQYPLVEATTVPIKFTPSGADIMAHEYTDAVNALIKLTATGLEVYCKFSPNLVAAEALNRFSVDVRSRMGVLEDIHWEFDVLEGVDPCLPPVEAFLV